MKKNTLLSCKDENASTASSSAGEETETDGGLAFEENRVETYCGEIYQTSLIGLENGETVTYTTNDDGVATVDETGAVYGVALGTAVIKATSSLGRTALIEITVLDGAMKAQAVIKLSHGSANLLVGDSLQIAAELSYKGKAYESAFAWESDNAQVATVQNGRVTAVASGTARLTVSAEYNGERVTAAVIVTVNELGLSICPDYAGLSLYAGTSQALSVSVMDGDSLADVENVTYSVTDTSVALVEGETLIARSKGGNVTVLATFTYQGAEYTVAGDVYVYGQHNVSVYASGELDRTLRGKYYGDTVTLELLNPEENRAVKCWYVDGERIDGNVFKMKDSAVVATAVYVNESEDDCTDRFSRSELINESTQASVHYVAGEFTDKNGAKNEMGGYVKLDTPNWSSAQFHFDENVKVTDTAKVKMRIYVPSSALLVYMGAGNYHKTIELFNIETPTPDTLYPIKIVNDQWIELEIPLYYFAEKNTTLGGFSICASSNSYCLIDYINIVY